MNFSPNFRIKLCLLLTFVLMLFAGFANAQVYGNSHDFGGTITNAGGSAGPDGYGSVSSVSFDSAGNMFGTTPYGGAYGDSFSGDGLVWEVTAAGNYVDLHDFGSGTDGFEPEAGVTVDRSGNLFGTTSSGGAFGGGMIWEITSAGVYKDLHDFGGTITLSDGTTGTDGDVPMAGVTVDSSGNLYGTTWTGGEYHVGLVWMLTAAGVYKDLHDFGAAITLPGGGLGTDGYLPHTGVIFDSSGNMYGTTQFGAQNDGGNLWEITAGGVYKDLFDFGNGSLSVGNIVVDSSGNLYGAVNNGSSFGYIYEYHFGGGLSFLHTFGGKVYGVRTVLVNDGTNPVSGVSMDSAGNLYGTVPTGGLNSDGLVWEITASASYGGSPAGTYFDLHDFGTGINGATDGTVPKSEVGITNSGNLFGTTINGGANGSGMVWNVVPISSLTINPTQVYGGSRATGTVTLAGPAPKGLAFIALTSLLQDPQVQQVPSLTFAPGTTSQSFTITTSAVNSVDNSGVVAGDGNQYVLANLTLVPAVLASISVNPTTVVGGNNLNLSILFNGVVETQTSVTLSSNNAAVVPPASTSVPQGNNPWSVVVNTVPTSTTINATITATCNGVTVTCPVTVVPPSIIGFTCTPSSIVGGATAGLLSVTLNGPTPPSGIQVNITSSNPSVIANSVMYFYSTQTLAELQIFGATVAAVTNVTLTATETLGTTSSKSVVVTVNPATLSGLTIAPTSTAGGTFATGTITLTGPAPTGGLAVKLYSDNVVASVPAIVTVPADQNVATFTINTTPVSTDQLVPIVATQGGVIKTANLTVSRPTLTGFTFAPSSVAAGTASTGTLTLSGPAPVGGVIVNLNNSSTDVSVPATVTIPPGATSGTFTANTSGVANNESVKIAATCVTTQYASITILPAALLSLSISPTTVVGGNPTTGTVTLTGYAGPGGFAVTLTSNSTNAMVPATVIVAQNHATATFPITTLGVVGSPTATITATLTGVSKTATLTITPASLSALTLSPVSIVCGNNGSGTVTLNGLAWPGGTVVNLSSNNANAIVPATVTVSNQTKTATFTVATTAVNSNSTATITATQGGVTQTAALTITPATLGSVTVNPNPVVGGQLSNGTVTLTGTAFSAMVVTLSSNNGGITVPASVTIPAGATSASFPVSTIPEGSTVTGTITATGNGVTQRTLMTVIPASFLGMSIAPTSVPGGQNATGTVTLNGITSTQVTINLSSNNPFAGVPATVIVYAGTNSSTFRITTVSVGSTTNATITASQGGNTQSANLSITPAINSLTLSPTSVTGGMNSTGTVTLAYPADPSGVVVSLSSSDPSATLPASVTVAYGATSATFTVTTSEVTLTTTATITATIATSSQSATLTELVPSLISNTLSPATIIGGEPTTGTVTLNEPALTGGAVIALSSNNSGISVPASVTIPAGSTSATYPVTTITEGSLVTAKITATYGAVVIRADITVNPSKTVVGLSLSPTSLAGGAPSTGTVTMNEIDPVYDTVISLSSNNGGVTVPATITVPAGSISTTFTVNTTPVGSTITATITAHLAASSQTASLTVNPPTIQSLTLAPTSVIGGVSSTGTVTLVTPAGTDTSVNLTSSDPSSTVPTTVIVYKGTQSSTFKVTTVPVTSTTVATISGSVGGTTQTAALTVNPPAVSTITIAPTGVLGGTSATGTVTLNGNAPSGGSVVTLASSIGCATVPATVTVPAGATTATFPINTVAVLNTSVATITATLGVSQTANLTVNMASVIGLTLSPSTVVGGYSTTGTVTINQPAVAAGVVVTLTSNNGGITVPGTVTIAGGSTTATFTVNTIVEGSIVSANVIATLGTSTLRTPIVVDPPVLLVGLTLSPPSLIGGAPSTGTITINEINTLADSVVTLSSNNGGITVPATVTIPAGTLSATFTIGTIPVGSTVTAQITATFATSILRAPITVNPAGLLSVTLAPSAVTGGQRSTGLVTLNAVAGATTTVSLSSSDPSTTVPATVTVYEGNTTASFPVTTSIVSTNTTAIITGTLFSISQTANLTLYPAGLAFVSVSPTSVSAGNPAAGIVTLNRPAPAGGTTVSLSSDSAFAVVPVSVTVPAGMTSIDFLVTTSTPATSPATATISASFGGVTQTAALTVNAPDVANVTLSPFEVTGGTSSTGTVSLTSVAPAGGMVVSLSSNNGGITVPATVTVPGGSTSATFTVTTIPVSSTVTAQISATMGGAVQKATITVDPPTLLSISVSPTSVQGGTRSIATVTLNGVAGSSTTITLSSDNPNATVPASVIVWAGSSSNTFSVNTTSVTSTTTVTITATLNGVSQTTTLTITP